MSAAPALTHIMDLLGRVDTAWIKEPGFGRDPNWRPQSPDIAELLDELVSTENRAALAAWYGRYSKAEMNSTARWLCEYLERRIGAPLAREIR